MLPGIRVGGHRNAHVSVGPDLEWRSAQLWKRWHPFFVNPFLSHPPNQRPLAFDQERCFAPKLDELLNSILSGGSEEVLCEKSLTFILSATSRMKQMLIPFAASLHLVTPWRAGLARIFVSLYTPRRDPDSTRLMQRAFHQMWNQDLATFFCCSRSRPSAWNWISSPGYCVARTCSVWMCTAAVIVWGRSRRTSKGIYCLKPGDSVTLRPGPLRCPRQKQPAGSSGTFTWFRAFTRNANIINSLASPVPFSAPLLLRRELGLQLGKLERSNLFIILRCVPVCCPQIKVTCSFLPLALMSLGSHCPKAFVILWNRMHDVSSEHI